MVFFCRDGDEKKVEPIRPPSDAQPGERVLVEGYETGSPDDVLNPKKKVWEKLAVDLVINSNGEASWNGNLLLTSSNKGKLTADTLKNAPIK